jgi:hypothetical protein
VSSLCRTSAFQYQSPTKVLPASYLQVERLYVLQSFLLAVLIQISVNNTVMLFNRSNRATANKTTPASPSQSLTLRKAVSSLELESSRTSSSAAARGSTIFPVTDLTPVNAREQYWAVRALTAETLLATKKARYRGLQDPSYREELKRLVSVLRGGGTII